MSKARVKMVPLHMGLMNGVEPTLVPDGYVTTAEDVYYPINSRSLRAVPDMGQIATTVAGAEAVHHAAFTDGTDFILLRGNSSGGFYRTLNSDGTSLSSDLAVPSDVANKGGLSDDPFFAFGYRDSHYLFDGESENMMINGDSQSDATVYRMGMSPVESPISVTFSTNGAGLSDFTEGNYYWFLLTEYDEDRDIESAYTADPVIAQVPSPLGGVDAFSIRMPERVNSNTTHFRIYLSSVTSATIADPPDLSTFFLQTEVEYSSQADYEILIDDDIHPNEANSPSANSGSWLNGANAYAEDGSSASAGSEGDEHIYSGFGFSFVTADQPIVGIRVRGVARKDIESIDLVALGVQLSWDAGSNWTDERQTQIFPATWAALELGNPSFKWGRTEWTPTELSDANFRVKVVRRGTDVDPATDLLLDHIYVEVFYRGSVDTDVIGRQYDVVAVTLPGTGEVVTTSANLKSEVANWGASFNGSVVANISSEAGVLQYSLPDKPESFPGEYRVRVDAPENEPLTAGRQVGDAFVAATKHSLHRIAGLPTGFEFTRDDGRVQRMISGRLGIVGPHAQCLFHPDGGVPSLAFIDENHGLCVTNGYQATPIVSQLDWEGMVSSAKTWLRYSHLIDYPAWGAMVLYYPSNAIAGRILDKRLIFHYHSIGEGAQVRVTGPCFAPFGGLSSVSRMERGSGIEHLYLDLSNAIGVTEANYQGGVTPSASPCVASPFFYLTGLLHQSRTERVFAHISGAATAGHSPAMTATVTGRQPDAAADNQLSNNYSPGSGDTGLINFPSTSVSGTSIAMDVCCSEWSGDLALDYFAIRYSENGEL